jgi:hypothetical protein
VLKIYSHYHSLNFGMFSKNEIYKYGIVIGAIVVLSASYLVLTALQGPDRAVASFEDCVRAGNPVMESYPRQCRAEDGRLFVEEIDEPVQVPEKDNNNDREGYDAERVPPELYPVDPYPAPDNGNVIKLREECRTTGCSGQICSDRDVVTTCEFRPEYACYDFAVCERQASGECGWTHTAESQSCLSQF